jgi:hypothetical protein
MQMYGGTGGSQWFFKSGSLSHGKTILKLEHGSNGADGFVTINDIADPGITGLAVKGDISASGGFFVSSSGNVMINSDLTGSMKTHLGSFSVNYGNAAQVSGSLVDAGQGYGDIIKFGGTTGLTAGYIYYLNSSGGWTVANATDNSAGADELLAVALGTNSDVDGMLLRGMVRVTHNAATSGRAVYMGTNAGRVADIAPSSNNNIVRIVGYAIGHGRVIYFNPDKTYIELS